MTWDVPHADVKTISYIRSEYAFNHAKMKGYLEVVKGLITGHDPYLLSFHSATGEPSQTQTIYRGLQDILIRNIVGSAGREKEFTRCFSPLTRSERQKERWRGCYTMTASGFGYQPIDVCQIDQHYFVLNGHHRVSVARYLNWTTIQAHVSELTSSLGQSKAVADVEPFAPPERSNL